MIVYRIIKYEGEAIHIADMFKRSIHGEYQPGKLKITAAPVEPRIIEAVPMILHALQQVAGKRWQLPVERQPVSALVPPPKHNASADAAREVAEFIAHIDEMLSDGFGWAADTLEGIQETVGLTGRVTEGQRTAVDNIENARR